MYFDKLKEYVKSKPKLECLYMCLKGLKDEDLARKIIGVKRNPYNLIMQAKGEQHPNENIYYINFDRGYEFNGFCSLFRFVLCHLAFAEDINMIPVVNWGREILYYDDTVTWTNNAFDYYFEPVSVISVEETLKCKHVVESKGLDASAFGTTSGYVIPNEEIVLMGNIAKKYMSLRKDVSSLINENFYTEGKTLGVHVRATDFNKGYNRHPKVVTPQEYLAETKKALNENDFQKIFLATDDSSVVELFKKEFGNRLCYYDDIYRSTDGEAIHYGNSNVQREHHKFKLGVEILKDFYTLGRCAGLIAGNSNVSICARIIKVSTGSSYKYVNIIDKGVNHNLHETRSVFNSMLKKK